MSHSPETQRIDKTMLDMEAVKPLYAASDIRTPAATPKQIELDPSLKMGDYGFNRKVASIAEAENIYLSTTRDARESLDEAVARNEHYTIAASATGEDLLTMSRAIAKQGEAVAAEHRLDNAKIDQSSNQLKAVIAYKLGDDRQIQSESVDSATYIVTALSLARTAENAADEAEKKAALLALDALRDVPESLESVQKTQVLGQHTGEIAVAAVLKHPDHN